MKTESLFKAAMLPHIDYELDDEGDVILTLENPNAPFAVWSGEDGPWELPLSVPPTLDDETMRRFRQIDSARQDEWGRSDVLWGSDASEAESPPADISNLSVQDTPHVSDLPEETMSEQTGLEDGGPNSKEVSPIRFRLSSRHLISASPYFRATLTGPWEESTSRADPWHNVSATDWDENALKLLMDIIHGNSHKVPRSVDLELLAKVAVLVDYYQCYDVVKFYSDTWIESLRETMNVTQFSRNSVLVLLISCVFFQGTTFHDLTYQAIQHAQGPLRLLELPFPTRLIEDIDNIREKTIGTLFDGFHNLLQYLTARNECDERCSAVLVGSLHRRMFAQGILSSRPERPFHGFSIAGVNQMACDTRTPGGTCLEGCSIEMFLTHLTAQVTSGVQGLELEKYVTNPWPNTAKSSLTARSSAS